MNETVTLTKEHIRFLLENHRRDFCDFLRRYFSNDALGDADSLFERTCEIVFSRMQAGEQDLIFDLRRALERVGSEVGIKWLDQKCKEQGLTTRVYRVINREPYALELADNL